jgi:hypothetical protein
MMVVEIYVLIDPLDFRPRYVGKAKSAKSRLRRHFLDARRRDSPVHCWIRKLIAAGRAPEVRIIETCEEQDWPMREKSAIASARAEWPGLLNVAAGGNEPGAPLKRSTGGPKAALARASTPHKRRFWELRRNLGQALQQGVVNERTKAKMRLAAQRHPHLFADWVNI